MDDAPFNNLVLICFHIIKEENRKLRMLWFYNNCVLITGSAGISLSCLLKEKHGYFLLC